MAVARIENGAIAELRDIEFADIPEHKRALWKPVVVEGSGPTVNYLVEPDYVRKVMSEPPLADVKRDLTIRLDADAESLRCRHITPGSGKAMSYQEKLAEARLVLDDPNAVNADLVPILAAEASVRGITIEQAAQLVHQTYLAFKALEAQINATTVAGKKAISGASDAASARAAYEAITWPSIQ